MKERKPSIPVNSRRSLLTGVAVGLTGLLVVPVGARLLTSWQADHEPPLPGNSVVPREGDLSWPSPGGVQAGWLLAVVSVGCPWCLRWEQEVLPGFVSIMADGGRCGLLLRDWPRDRQALQAAVFLGDLSKSLSLSIADRLGLRQRLSIAPTQVYEDARNGLWAASGVMAARAAMDEKKMLQALAAWESDGLALHVHGTPTFVKDEFPPHLGFLDTDGLARKFLL